MSLLELALNVHAGRVEKHTQGVIMNRCHGFWSLGIMTGSLLGSLFYTETTVWMILIMCALALLPLAWLLCLGLPSYENITSVEVSHVFVIPQFPAILIYICIFK